MQKGPILMEPITIKARLNQAYHFSGAAGNGIRFSDLSDDPAFVFREDTSAVHNRFVPAGGRISYASPRPSDAGCAAVPPLSLCRIRKRHFNDCRRRCAGAGILPACTGGSHASSGSDRIPVFHDAYPFLLPLFLSVHRVFFGISSVFVCERPHFSYEPDRGG